MSSSNHINVVVRYPQNQITQYATDVQHKSRLILQFENILFTSIYNRYPGANVSAKPFHELSVLVINRDTNQTDIAAVMDIVYIYNSLLINQDKWLY